MGAILFLVFLTTTALAATPRAPAGMGGGTVDNNCFSEEGAEDDAKEGDDAKDEEVERAGLETATALPPGLVLVLALVLEVEVELEVTWILLELGLGKAALFCSLKGLLISPPVHAAVNGEIFMGVMRRFFLEAEVEDEAGMSVSTVGAVGGSDTLVVDTTAVNPLASIPCCCCCCCNCCLVTGGMYS